MKWQIREGTSNQVVRFRVLKTDGSGGYTGLTFTDFTAAYKRDDGTTAALVPISLSSKLPGQYVDGGIAESDAALAPGTYELGIPALATIAGSDPRVFFWINGPADAHIDPIEIELMKTNWRIEANKADLQAILGTNIGGTAKLAANFGTYFENGSEDSTNRVGEYRPGYLDGAVWYQTGVPGVTP